MKTEKKKEELKRLSKKLRGALAKVREAPPGTEKEAERELASVTKELERLLRKMGRSQRSDLSEAEKELLEENRLLKKRLLTLGEKYRKLKELERTEGTTANLKQTVSYYKDRLETAKEKNRALQEELEKKEKFDGSEIKEKREQEKELKKNLEELQTKNKSLEEQLKNLQSQIKTFEEKTSTLTEKNQRLLKTLQEKDQELKKLEEERTRAVSRIMELRSKQEPSPAHEPEGKKKPHKPKKVTAPEKAKKEPTKDKKTLEERLREEKKIAPIVNNIPNIINGVVKSKEGALLEGIIVIIKDSDGDPVRAVKTNKLGQFAVSTPLPNGRYTVKVNKSNYKPVKVATDGSVLDPIIFRERN